MTTKLNPFAAAPQPMKSGRSTSMDIAASLEPSLIELVNIRASQINGCANLYLVMLPIYTPIVRLLAIAFYFFLATRVAAARGKFGVRLPATTGNPDFERTFRAHMNTLEWMPAFLVALWLCAIYLNDIAAAVLGLVWIVGRAVYFPGYSRAVEKRLPGFFIQSTASTACLLLFIGAGAGVVMQLLGS